MTNKADLLAALNAEKKTLPVSVQLGDLTMELNVPAVLSGDDRAAFVDSVSDGVIDNGKRRFALYDLAFGKAVLRYCTDFSVALSDADIEYLIEASNLVAAVREAIPSVLDSLDKACRAQLKMSIQNETAIAAALIRPDPFDRIADMLEDFLSSASASIGNIKFSDISQAIDTLKAEGGGGQIIDHALAFLNKEGDHGAENAAEPVDLSGTDKTD